MIAPDAKLSIRRIPLECIQVKMRERRYVERIQSYVAAMSKHPESDVLLNVTPSDTHPGMYCVLDGHHRLLASLVMGRTDALCVVIEEK